MDLLDSANLADNAFLFIGQGMVDQALALRPEERRPLFEEVAGVRRHERRRRKAEEQLEESEGNLARVEDILAELRPQARRLAAQAEQQQTRATAGEELADALILAAHSRWYGAATRLVAATAGRQAAAAASEAATGALRLADERAATIAAELGTRAAVERDRRTALEAARQALTALQLREARLVADLEAAERDERRSADERTVAEADLATARRILAEAVPAPRAELETAAAEAERALAEAVAELGALQAASQAHGEEAASLRRAEAARRAESEIARRRLDEAEGRAREERARAEAAFAHRATAQSALGAARETLATAQAVEGAARADREAADALATERDAARRAATDSAATAATALAAAEARLAAAEARLADEERRGIAKAARRQGGRRVDDELDVEPGLRRAVEAALGDAARGYIVARDQIPALQGERGVLVTTGDTGRTGRKPAAEAAGRGIADRARAMGGGPLVEAIRRDVAGAASDLLARAVWLPDLAACLELAPELPAGWVAVPRDGSAVVSSITARLGAPEGSLDLRDEAIRLRAEVERARRDAEERARAASVALSAARQAAEARARAAEQEAAAVVDRRRAEEAERVAARALDAGLREAGWHEAQADRMEADVARARQAVEEAEPAPAPATTSIAEPDRAALSVWEARVGELRARRDRLAGELAGQQAARRDGEGRRARAEASAAFAEERLARVDRDAALLAERRIASTADREALAAELSAAALRETQARAEVGELEAADAADRDRLAAAEREATAARLEVRAADDRLRAADHAEVESRLGLEGLREQLLVELAGLGELGRTRLSAQAGAVAATDDAVPDPDDDAALLEAALDAVAPAWAAAAATEDAPSPGRLAVLRRRYHELGAANPFAADEYAEVKERLETLETQQDDLRAAIATTRQLIDDLNRMIATQFQATFRALEAAFDRQFNRLFGGGFAKLSLTDPGDLSATGVEIVARPPGKKAQSLAMLSGGERALTAVALLFAMLEVRPVPFCVLDEVDAALDEANVGRFSEALRDLAERTQFVVITHNRGTIEAADALYGVTVGDDSVSRVISLRLEEARAIAGRSRSQEPAGITVA